MKDQVAAFDTDLRGIPRELDPAWEMDDLFAILDDEFCGQRHPHLRSSLLAYQIVVTQLPGGGGGTRTPVRIWLIQGFYRLIPV